MPLPDRSSRSMGDRMRIAMIAACPFPWPRGTPVRIHRLAQAVARRGHDVHVLAYHLGQALERPEFTVHRIRDVPSYRYTAPGPTLRKLVLLDPMLSRLLRTLEREQPFDVVHAHHYEGILVATCARTATPIVYDAHTMLTGELPYYRLGLPRWFKRWIGGVLDRRLPRRAARIVAVSASIRDQLIAIGAAREGQVSVIPNGVDWRRFEPASDVHRPGENLIFTGNLAAYQGVDLMLDALAVLRRRRPGVRLLIVTESSFDAFEEQARGLGVREAIDVCSAPLEQLPALLAGADVALSPRVDCDGIPQKLLNYMAAGKAIVSFCGSGATLTHERTGLCVPDGDTRVMADAIDRLLSDRILADRLGAAARKQVQTELSWDHAAARVEQVYRESLR
jgi:glycosyltransferase involved in cell wall biosynthesis